jgi:hypothetical protein
MDDKIVIKGVGGGTLLPIDITIEDTDSGEKILDTSEVHLNVGVNDKEVVVRLVRYLDLFDLSRRDYKGLISPYEKLTIEDYLVESIEIVARRRNTAKE